VYRACFAASAIINGSRAIGIRAAAASSASADSSASAAAAAAAANSHASAAASYAALSKTNTRRASLVEEHGESS